jgi:hypothetical protein
MNMSSIDVLQMVKNVIANENPSEAFESKLLRIK